MDLALDIRETKVAADSIAIFWLGQAGFIIKDHKGRRIAIDPYLTDCVEKEFGFKRLAPKLISADDLDLDVYLVTHDHLDHYDTEAAPIIMKNKKTYMYGSVSSIKLAKDSGIESSRLHPMEAGEEIKHDNISIRATYADHGSLAPDAIGFLLKIGTIAIYYAGDTGYNPKIARDVSKLNPDIIILPINGRYGNLNGEAAAKLAVDADAEIAIPCHFWMFAEHNGDPEDFLNHMQKLSSKCEAKVMCMGEMISYSGNS